MSELPLQVNLQNTPTLKDFYSYPEAAIWMEISPRAFRYLLEAYRDHIKEYIFKAVVQERKRKVISGTGLIVLKNLKDKFYGNQFIKQEAQLPVLTAKKKIAERAIQVSVNPPQVQPKSDIQVLLQTVQAMADMEKRFDTKIEEVKQLAISAPPEKMTNPQREFLNERVRYYASKTEVPHWRVWGKLHAEIGKQTIEKYEFGDYKRAMQYLKFWYKEANISFE